MIEVIVLCEGHTEREFCNSVVSPYLTTLGIAFKGTLAGNPDRKRGGIRPWQAYRNELVRFSKERQGRHVALLVDYYALHPTWPGRVEARDQPNLARGAFVEQALMADLVELRGRFHPCIQLHEFESLLFVDTETTALNLAVDERGMLALAQQLEAIKAQFGGQPEAINDAPETAPSKRIEALVSSYDKVGLGPIITKEATLDKLRQGCPWLNRWLERLAGLQPDTKSAGD